MKSKVSVSILIVTFFVIALLLLFYFLMILHSGELSNRTGSIGLPATGGYVEAWTPYLPSIAKTVGLPEIIIKTYSSDEELQNLFISKEKINLIWAEIPISQEYNIENIRKQDLLSPLDESTKEFFPTQVYDSVQRTDKALSSNNYCLPISYNPWIFITKNTQTEELPLYEYSLPAKEKNYLETIAAWLLSSNPDLSTFETSDSIYIEKDFCQPNSLDYTYDKALDLFLENKTKAFFTNIEEYNNFSLSQQQNFSIRTLNNTIITDATIAIFAKRDKEISQQIVSMAKNYLLIPEIVYNTADKRNWLPIHIGTVSRNLSCEYIKKQTRRANNIIIPSIFFKNEEEKRIFLSKITDELTKQ